MKALPFTAALAVALTIMPARADEASRAETREIQQRQQGREDALRRIDRRGRSTNSWDGGLADKPEPSSDPGEIPGGSETPGGNAAPSGQGPTSGLQENAPGPDGRDTGAQPAAPAAPVPPENPFESARLMEALRSEFAHGASARAQPPPLTETPAKAATDSITLTLAPQRARTEDGPAAPAPAELTGIEALLDRLEKGEPATLGEIETLARLAERASSLDVPDLDELKQRLAVARVVASEQSPPPEPAPATGALSFVLAPDRATSDAGSAPETAYRSPPRGASAPAGPVAVRYGEGDPAPPVVTLSELAEKAGSSAKRDGALPKPAVTFRDRMKRLARAVARLLPRSRGKPRRTRQAPVELAGLEGRFALPQSGWESLFSTIEDPENEEAATAAGGFLFAILAACGGAAARWALNRRRLTGDV